MISFVYCIDVSLLNLKLIAFVRENLDTNICLKSLHIEKVDMESFSSDVFAATLDYFSKNI